MLSIWTFLRTKKFFFKFKTFQDVLERFRRFIKSRVIDGADFSRHFQGTKSVGAKRFHLSTAMNWDRFLRYFFSSRFRTLWLHEVFSASKMCLEGVLHFSKEMCYYMLPKNLNKFRISIFSSDISYSIFRHHFNIFPENQVNIPSKKCP